MKSAILALLILAPISVLADPPKQPPSAKFELLSTEDEMRQCMVIAKTAKDEITAAPTYVSAANASFHMTIASYAIGLFKAYNCDPGILESEGLIPFSIPGLHP